MNVLSKVNDVYKEIKPIAKSVISALPGGGYINQGLDFVSGAVDKVAPITNAWIDASDRAKISQYTDKSKRLIGDVSNRLVNSYFDVQDALSNKPEEEEEAKQVGPYSERGQENKKYYLNHQVCYLEIQLIKIKQLC